MLDLMKILCPLLSVIFGFMALTALIHRRYVSFLVNSVIGAAAGSVVLFLPNSTAARSEPKPENSSSPVPAGSAGDVQHIPWEMLGFIAVILVLIATVVIGIVFIVPHIKKKMNNKSENLRAWKDVIQRHDDVRKQWASYEMDMNKIIDMPVMTDMREPAIIALHKALKTASSLDPKSLAKLVYVPVQDSAFFSAVNDLEVAFRSAEQEAKKIAWSKFSKEERRSLSTAKKLLSLAMDSGASPAERQAAYKRVFKELQGIIEFPEKTRLEIESRHQLELAA
jgi:hypothetical protein